MSLNYILALIVLSMILINVYIRIRVLKSYKQLKNKDIDMDPKLILSKKKRLEFYKNHPSEDKQAIEEFSQLLNNLIKYVLVGFVVLLALFAYIYLTQ